MTIKAKPNTKEKSLSAISTFVARTSVATTKTITAPDSIASKAAKKALPAVKADVEKPLKKTSPRK